MSKKSTIESYYVEDISRRPKPLSLVLEAHVEMLNSKTVDVHYGVPIESSGEAIIAYNTRSDNPVGIITFYTIPGTDSIYISLSYVKKKYRQKGIWSDMRNFLARHAYDKGIRHIFSGVFANNEASLAANRRRGVPSIITFKEAV